MGTKMKNVAIIVPAYNEEHSISETVRVLRELNSKFSLLDATLSIYVIDDGSTDNTAEHAQAAGADVILSHPVNQGLGAAVRTGFMAAKRNGVDILVKFDADLQHDPEDILPLIAPILRGEVDLVYGDRFAGMQYRMPFVRRVGNRAFTTLMRWLTGLPVKDSQPGILAASKEYIQQCNLPGDYNYTQQILLDAYHKNMRFAQVPVSFRERKTGKSFISLMYPFKVIPQIFQVLIAVKPLKVFGPIGLCFILVAFLVGASNILEFLSGRESRPIQYVNLVLGFGLFGVQTLFFGFLADLINKMSKRG